MPTYRVCQLARKHVTVALSGDGGDENFAGYRRYRYAMAEERVRGLLPAGLREPVFGALGSSIRRPTGRRACSAPRPRSRRWRATSVEGYFHGVSIMPRPTCATQLFSPSVQARAAGLRRDRGVRAATPPARRPTIRCR